MRVVRLNLFTTQSVDGLILQVTVLHVFEGSNAYVLRVVAIDATPTTINLLMSFMQIGIYTSTTMSFAN